MKVICNHATDACLPCEHAKPHEIYHYPKFFKNNETYPCTDLIQADCETCEGQKICCIPVEDKTNA